MIRRHAGFTLIELSMIIVLLGIMASFAMIPFRPNPQKIEGQARQLVGDIRYIQQLSMAQYRPFRINFSGNSYSFTQEDGVTAAPHPGFGSNILALGDSITLLSSGIPNGYLVFSSFGVPYIHIDGTKLTTLATIQLSLGGETRTITISPETGRVTLS